jgi:A/G-specific adenine glycosylase
MLQQTQVDRVVPFYKNFVKKFPTARALARAPLSEALRAWQGLGYNRRAKFLHEAAKAIVKKGAFPKTVETMEELSGVGHYTARAVAAFAFNTPVALLETNVRTVLFHHLTLPHKVSDKQLLPLVEALLYRSRMTPRDFYSAMMDYGAHLKRAGVRLNRKSSTYKKQSKFKGSARELRGAILRELLSHRATLSMLVHRIPRNKEEMTRELSRLAAEGLISLKGRYFSVRK